MTNPNQSQGCKFCIRHGLPILLARPAIMSQHDILPVMPENIKVPVEAQGETAYTLRLLRSGYLNIWDEVGNAWINYFVTEGGFYYPLIENGDVPDDVASGKIKPCIDQPEELAKASLITLPMMPPGMKSGLFWFAWSEVKWTAAIRKQFENKSHREQYMQPFDMDAWLANQQAPQALPLAQLENTIAEYHQHARKSQMRGWSATLLSRAVDGFITYAYRFKSQWLAPTASGQQIETVVNAKSDGLDPRGAMLVLQDPTGILKDLSTLIQYELDQNVYKRPDIEREVMLSAAITSLKDGMTKDFQLNFMSITLREEAFINSIDIAYPEGDITATLAESQLDSDFIRYRKSVMVAKTKAHWAQYEQYYKPHALDMFNLRFQGILQEYNSRVVHPRTQLYLNWFQSLVLVNYFMRNFDADDLLSGMAYTATLTYCVANMMDKKGVLDFFSESLLRDFTDPSNVVARGLALNHDALIQKIQESVAKTTDWWALPWNSLVDAVTEVVDKADLAARGVIGIYTAGISAAIMHITTRVLGSQKVYAFMVALGIFQNRAVISIQRTGQYKHFVTYVISTLMTLNNGGVKPNPDVLRHRINIEYQRLEALGFPMFDEKSQAFLIDIHLDKFNEISPLPRKEKEMAMGKTLFSTNQTEDKYLAKWNSQLTTGTGKTLTLMGTGILSTILQGVAVLVSADFGNKKTLTDEQLEENSRFVAGATGAVGGFFGVLEIGIKDFVQTPNVFNARAFNQLKALESASRVVGRGLGLFAGVVTVGFDLYHMSEEWNKNNYGLSAAYFTSAVSGIWLTCIIFASTLPPLGLAVTLIAFALVLASAVWIAIEGQNGIQKWLERCLWRNVPGNVEVEYWPSIYPTLRLEMENLTLALG